MSDFPREIKPIESEDEKQSARRPAEPETADDVDLSVLLDFEEEPCDDEPDLIVELIDLYLATFPQQLSEMKDFIARGDEVSLKRAAHNLKGSSSNLGVNRIARLCEEIEQLDLINSAHRINASIDLLHRSFERVRAVFLAERQNRTQ